MLQPKRILYAGDSVPGGAANYLLGILGTLPLEVTHVPPAQTMRPSHLTEAFDGIILSDYPRKKMPSQAEKKICAMVEAGAGLLMVGGWASYSGPDGHWSGTLIERYLPVKCRKTDDRLNFPSGAFLCSRRFHPVLEKISFKNPPVILGMNSIQVKPSGVVVLGARRSRLVRGRVKVDRAIHPVFVVDRDPERRIAALTTDLAPHWCGGLVDWGTRCVWLPVRPKIMIGVGNDYVRFVQAIIRWLCRL